MRLLYLFSKFIIWSGLIGGASLILILCALAIVIVPNLPTPDSLKEVQLQTPLRIYTKDSKLIAEFGEKRRQPLTYPDIPQHFINALLAAEDTNFFNHNGVDLKGLARATKELVFTGQKQSGGSTITMQVARNFFLTRKQTFTRKFNEIFLALDIERQISKEEIMELYVNKIYLGHRSYGIAAAAQVYYGKELNQLTLAELAMIAGLPKAPSRFNPITNPSRALIRRNWILGRMELLNFISSEEHDEAVKRPITAKYHGLKTEVDAPYLAEMVRKEMLDRYGSDAYNLGLTVHTTIHSENQLAANEAVQLGILEYEERHGYRGPEATHPIPLGMALFEASNNAPGTSAPNSTPETTADFIDFLGTVFSNIDNVGPLIPAFVTHVSDKEAQIVFKEGHVAVIDFDEMKWAREFITINQMGPPPKSASDILTKGDLIRVRLVTRTLTSKDESERVVHQWRLTQIPEAQAALVSLNPYNGALEAIVGGFDFYHSKFNRAIQAGRQAGSSFKPFIYSAAIANGYTAASLINDAPIVLNDSSLESDWRPQNSGGKFYGPTRLRKALYKSRNLVSIRMLRRLGIQKTLNYVERFGFNANQLPRNLSLALGSADLTPMEIATGYTAFANGGFKVSPYFIQTIADEEGTPIYQANPALACRECRPSTSAQEPDLVESVTLLNEEPLFEPDPAEADRELSENTNSDPGFANIAPRIEDERVIHIVRDIMQDVIKKGTGRRALALGRGDIAGKTGTTNDQKDAWFAGYNGEMVATAWLGFDNPTSLGSREYGAKAALPIWMHYMKAALDGRAETSYPMPADMISVKIDPETGEAVHPSDPNGMMEIFRTENAPKLDLNQIPPGNNPYGSEGGQAIDSIDEIF